MSCDTPTLGCNILSWPDMEMQMCLSRLPDGFEFKSYGASSRGWSVSLPKYKNKKVEINHQSKDLSIFKYYQRYLTMDSRKPPYRKLEELGQFCPNLTS